MCSNWVRRTAECARLSVRFSGRDGGMMGRVLIQGVGLLSLCGRDGGMMGRVLIQGVGLLSLCGRDGGMMGGYSSRG